jgi:hypothetical protein
MTAPDSRTDDHDDVEGHRLAANDNEIVIDDTGSPDDVEGHRLASNDNEVVIDDADSLDPDVSVEVG